jgi:hypothetical protein
MNDAEQYGINKIIFSNQNKNFKEDDIRSSSFHKRSKSSATDFCDMKSEISDGRRIDLDGDVDSLNYFQNKGITIVLLLLFS